MKRIELINNVYNQFDENARLTRDRNGQLEYISTMEYIHRYCKNNDKIIEIGAGTGRYSIALAKEGYDMTAVELVQHNLDILKENGKGLDNLHPVLGDGTNLSQFEDNSFGITLVFGPMYHLYDSTDVHKAMDEAIRITKKNGVILFAFISIYAIFNCDYTNNHFKDGLALNLNEDYSAKHHIDQVFTGYDIVEFEQLFKDKEVEYLTTAGMDNVLEIFHVNNCLDMNDDNFKEYVKYHLAICEKRELLGVHNHLLSIVRKK